MVLLDRQGGKYKPYEYNDLFLKFLKSPQAKKNPFVGGFGFGARSRLFGYFLRADWAWGVEDGYVLPHILYISLGLDF